MKLTPLQSGFCVSVFSHAVAFGLVAWVGNTQRPASVEHDASALLLNLIAAPVEASSPTPARAVEVVVPAEPLAMLPARPPVTVEIPIAPEPTAVTRPARTETSQQPPVAKILQTEKVEIAAPSPPVTTRVDGSSPRPAEDVTIAETRTGAVANPNYLKNPEPPYPIQARRRGQEGLVILEVRVTRLGRASEISMKQSSGFPLLDDAAIKAVREWEFDPAKVGMLPVESRIEIPVRFRLSK